MPSLRLSVDLPVERIAPTAVPDWYLLALRRRQLRRGGVAVASAGCTPDNGLTTVCQPFPQLASEAYPNQGSEDSTDEGPGNRDHSRPGLGTNEEASDGTGGLSNVLRGVNKIGHCAIPFLD